ncbi:hypothetical protein F4860DRAFT_52024 [Xylaria cubensis]|nr:hypothetical protein F4860DRAFT_52024 [Xylaria cubensis]
MTLATQYILLFLAFAIHFTTCTANLPPGVAGPRWPSFFEAPVFHLKTAAIDILNVARAWAAQADEDLHRDPGGTILRAWDAAKFAIVIAPGLLWGPALNLLGFGTGGVGSGSAAAAAQSARAGGYGVAVMDAVTRGGVLLFEGGKWVARQFNNTGT